ncbi:AMP-binding protein [Actinospongicola halichondriae]|uniref:AMP-binding protein n=1 Tax=Actinospongicola halichondriae TaxID=3236844 RepID=UPI003D393D4F
MTPVYEALFGTAATHPERPCLLLEDGTVLSYGDVDHRAACMAGGLAAHGVVAGDRVVVHVGKSPDAVALYLACLRSGAVHVPLNTAYTRAEVGAFVDDAAAALFVDDDLLPTLATSAVDDVAPRSGDDWAAMLYTSGTTGRSKGAMLSCDNLVSNARVLHDAWGFTPDDVLVHVLPVFHVHGLFVALHCAFLAGAAVRFHTRFDPSAVVDDLRRSTVMMGVPTHYHRLLDQTGLDPDDCRGMRLFTSGSAPLLPERHDQFSERTGHRIVERYGMTETMILTSNPLDGERVAGTVGFPLPGVDLRIGADELVEVRTDGLFLGYWQEPDKTAASMTDDGWFVTGDVGSLDDDGRLTLAGRQSDMIISGGLNIYPKEIEVVLDAVDGVDESAVVGVPDADFGESIVAVIVGSADEDTLAAACENSLARFKHPQRYRFVDALPRNAMGKVQKVELRREISS